MNDFAGNFRRFKTEWTVNGIRWYPIRSPPFPYLSLKTIARSVFKQMKVLALFAGKTWKEKPVLDVWQQKASYSWTSELDKCTRSGIADKLTLHIRDGDLLPLFGKEEGRSRSRGELLLQKALRSGGQASSIHLPEKWGEVKDTNDWSSEEWDTGHKRTTECYRGSKMGQ